MPVIIALERQRKFLSLRSVWVTELDSVSKRKKENIIYYAS
jgi:hypothetical protein